MAHPAQVNVASSSVVSNLYKGLLNSECEPWPVWRPVRKAEFMAIPVKMSDGSVRNRIVGGGHAARMRRVLIVGRGRGGWETSCHISGNKVSMRNW